MRKIILSIVLAFLSIARVYAGVPYQLPGVSTCEAQSGCAVALDGSGYLTDTTSQKKIFDLPFAKTVFDSYSLMKSGDKYVVERSNTTSSRNWDLLLFTYVGGVPHAERLVSLSRGIDVQSPEVYWAGYECRGDALMQKQYSPYDAAKKALCGREYEPSAVSLEKSATFDAVKNRGLVVGIPVYGLSSKLSVAYFFPGSDEPDAASLLCLQNCKSQSRELGHFGGWVDKNLWIDLTLHNSGEADSLSGSYFYIGKNGKIDLAGNYLNGRLHLRESTSNGAGGERIQATFEGFGSKDAMVGKWRSVLSGKTYNFFIALRIY
ncbi:hypothetical protein DP57_5995 [Burkholderia pseudomallei]|uniref:hypothetical protein n=1 Tax=Burkholderia pseudomallei TaxID=28450 RepID=UPI00050EA5E1|nr:hypothetical protein [Burkholderia pseudomallei]KGC70105.1 hypothetical protein DP57_5995 [Burkholderia pseudomallei]